MRVTREGVSIHFEARGEGPPLLLIPGLGLDGGVFDRLVLRLERRFTCVGIDPRGAGLSDAPRGPYAIAELAADAAAVVRGAGFASAFVLGHSMGGFTALELALEEPEVVRGLVLVSTAACGGAERLGQSDEARAALARRQGTAGEIAAGILAACLTPEFVRDRPDDFERFVAGRLARPASGRGLAGQRAAAEGFDATARAERIRVPAAVVHGDADRVVSADKGRELAAAIPGAVLHVLGGVGHMPFWEAPGALADAALALLSRP